MEGIQKRDHLYGFAADSWRWYSPHFDLLPSCDQTSHSGNMWDPTVQSFPFFGELVPLEISGMLGTLGQVVVVAGIVTTSVLALLALFSVPVNMDDAIIAEYPIWEL